MQQQPITSDMTMLDIIASWPETETVFKSYDKQLGRCLCCEALFDSLAATAQQYQLDLDQLLSQLRQAISNS